MNTIKRVARNTGVIILTNILNKIISLFVIIYLARYLGDAGYGQYAFIFAFVGLFGIISITGIDTILVREISKDKSRASKLIANGAGIKLLLSVSSIIFAVASITFLGYPQNVTTAVYIASVALLFSALRSTFTVPFQANLRMEYSAIPRFIDRIISASLIFWIIYSRGSLVDIIVVETLSKLLNLILTLHYSKKFILPRVEIDLACWREIIKPAIPIALTSVFILIYYRIDTVMLSMMQGDSAVGYYAVVYPLTEALGLVSGALMISLFPLMSGYYKTSRESLLKTYKLGFRYMSMLALPLAVGTTILSKEIILLVYGTEFLPSVSALSILIWAEVFIFVNIVFGNTLTAINRQKMVTITTGVCVILNVIMNLILIPKFSYVGASVATVFTEALSFLFLLFFTRKYLGEHPFTPRLISIVISSTIMAVVVLSIQAPVLITAVVGIFIYSLAMYLTKGFTSEDIQIMKKIIIRK